MSAAGRKARLGRLEQRADRVTGGDLRRHWARVNEERNRTLVRFWEALPDSHAGPLVEAFRAIGDKLFIDAPAWLEEEYPALQRWFMQRVAWGDDHPLNPPFPGPVPGALIDLLIAHPDAELNSSKCGGCGHSVPSTRSSGKPDGSYRWPQPLTDTCPVCAAHVPPPPRC